jgi:hypothetical protein
MNAAQRAASCLGCADVAQRACGGTLDRRNNLNAGRDLSLVRPGRGSRGGHELRY